MDTYQYLQNLNDAIRKAPINSINAAIKLIQETVEKNKTIYVCGNGGSALTASHFVTDWAKMSWVNRKQRFKAYCLSDNIGMLTAYANDIEYEDVFSEPLRNYSEEGDLLIVVSGSGNSRNVCKAVDTARELNIKTIALSGFDGGMISKISDVSVHFEVHDMQIVEDLHLSFGHIVMKQLC